MRVRFALLAILSALPLAAQTKHSFTFEDMMALKRVGEPVPSPDGKWVLFAAVDVDLKANTKTPHVWVVPLSQATAGSSTPQDNSPSANHPAPVGMTDKNNPKNKKKQPQKHNQQTNTTNTPKHKHNHNPPPPPTPPPPPPPPP